ncbi:uncharacterized protein LOC110735399 isoform X2 [Chenopodium quinoa]|uniref:uncharacterized protein LOC110735399 isoform X2 n=1 Tax=Chenopodium quinoa TaxID=63459 RepID=UPI000B77D884|nr:uncharacterized protein LOC110735399 isoform X2 [Chenopodium quinoa]XP_021771280.1 uncharacterized protein LOC110735399 isoform X2 [Chenopodium quinoa]
MAIRRFSVSETCTLSLSQFEGEMIGQRFMFFVTCQFEGGKSQILKKLREDEASEIEGPYYYGMVEKEAAECEGVSSGCRMNGGSGFADLAEPGYLVVACFSSSSLFYWEGQSTGVFEWERERSRGSCGEA